MNSMIKYGLLAFISITIAVIFLKPILTHEHEYRVVVVNISERPVSNITISGAGIEPKNIGPIQVGNMQDYYFILPQDGQLSYTITQDKHQFDGIITPNIKKAEVGKRYIVIGEMYKVKVYDDYQGAY